MNITDIEDVYYFNEIARESHRQWQAPVSR